MDKPLGFFPEHWESPSPLLSSASMPFGIVDTCGDAVDSQHLSQCPRRGGQERPPCSPAPHIPTAPLPPAPLPLSLFPFPIIVVRAGPAWRSAKGVLCTSSSYSSRLALGKASIQRVSFARSQLAPLAVEPNSKIPVKHPTWAFIPPALPHSLSPGRRAWSPPAHPAVAGGQSPTPTCSLLGLEGLQLLSHSLTRPLSAASGLHLR